MSWPTAAGPAAPADWRDGAARLRVLEEFRRWAAPTMSCSWSASTGRPERHPLFVARRPAPGFTDDEIAQLQRVTRELGIALKSKIERSVAQNVAHAYLGKRAGQAVLNGLIRRGDGENHGGVVVQRSAPLDGTRRPAFGRSFPAAARPLFRDDGVRGARSRRRGRLPDRRCGARPVPRRRRAEDACGRALAAAHEARRRLGAQAVAADRALDFGISLHLGQVIYGNVGVPERLQFTLVGSAVNEVVRVQDLTKQLGYPLLATAPFAGARQEPGIRSASTACAASKRRCRS